MLTLTAPQMNRFDDAAWDAASLDVSDFLQANAPWAATVWSEPERDAIAAFACARGRAHGLRSVRQIALYALLMTVLGGRFDENPSLPWAAAKLRDPRIREPVHRIDQLVDMAMLHVRRCAGRDGALLARRLAAVRAALADRQIPGDVPRAALAAFPEHAHQRPGVQAIAAEAGLTHAPGFGLEPRMGGFLCAGLAILFGPHYHADPVLPAIGALLHDRAAPGDTRTDALRLAVIGLIDGMLPSLAPPR